MELNIIDNKGQANGSVQFDDALLVKRGSPAVLHEIVVAHLAAQRSGTHNVKTRSQVSGGGIKPWKQKHTGNARSGSTRSPLWRKGGVIFGPVSRDHSVTISRKKKLLAFRMAIGELLREERLQVVEPIQLKEAKTKAVAAVYAKWKVPQNSILLVDKIDATFQRASRNVPSVQVQNVSSFNTYECLKARKVFITPAALTELTARIAPAQEN